MRRVRSKSVTVVHLTLVARPVDLDVEEIEEIDYPVQLTLAYG
jgi:hypothetical protein